MKLTKTLFLIITSILFTNNTFAQCNPIVKDQSGEDAKVVTYCVGEPVPFRANSPGHTTSITWIFGDGSTSSDQNPSHSYSSAGIYTVNYNGSGGAGTCNQDLTVIIKPSPTINVHLQSSETQCFENNEFCLLDTSKAVPGIKIVRMTYLWNDGQRIDRLCPTFPYTVCKTFTDPTGGFFDLTIEAEDANGCISRIKYTDLVQLHPKVGLEVDLLSSSIGTDCDTVEISFENKSYFPFYNVASFRWDFSDGDSIVGDSITNAAGWFGVNDDKIFNHTFTNNGPYNVTLQVEAKTGCKSTFTNGRFVNDLVPQINHTYRFLNCSHIVNFSDSSYFTTECVSANADSIVSYKWDFGDGTAKSTLANPTHQFARTGSFNVVLLVKSAFGQSKYVTKTIYIPGTKPEFAFLNYGHTYNNAAHLCQGDSLFIKNVSKYEANNNTVYQMNWGDGTTSTLSDSGTISSHYYTGLGTYELSLTAFYDVPGQSVRCSTVYPDTNVNLVSPRTITATVNETPTANFTVSENPIYAGTSVTFNAILSAEYNRMMWDFGDGTTADTTSPTTSIMHTYDSAGTYSVELIPLYNPYCNRPVCSDTVIKTFDVLPDTTTSIRLLYQKMSIYPNPNAGIFMMQLNTGTDVTNVVLTDALGRVVKAKYRLVSNQLIEVEAKDLTNGNYTLIVETGLGKMTEKIVVIR